MRGARLAAVAAAGMAVIGGATVVLQAPAARAHTCVKVALPVPPTTIVLPPGEESCDFGHHPTCVRLPVDGLVVVCVD